MNRWARWARWGQVGSRTASNNDGGDNGRAVDSNGFEYWSATNTTVLSIPPFGVNGVDTNFEYWQSGLLPPVVTVV